MIWQQTRSQPYAMVATRATYHMALFLRPDPFCCADSVFTQAQGCALSNLLLSQL